jgi:hypothetical protein
MHVGRCTALGGQCVIQPKVLLLYQRYSSKLPAMCGEQCRIPKTATRRGAVCYAKLLTRVDARAENGYGFEGELLKPGSRIAESDLAGRTILLECTDIEGSRDYRGRCKWDKLYILWRFERESNSWIEIARTQCHSGEWCEVLREPARIALGKTSWGVVPSVAETIIRIRGMLDQELQGLEDGAKRQVLGELYDQFASRMVKAQEVA